MGWDWFAAAVEVRPGRLKDGPLPRFRREPAASRLFVDEYAERMFPTWPRIDVALIGLLVPSLGARLEQLISRKYPGVCPLPVRTRARQWAAGRQAAAQGAATA